MNSLIDTVLSLKLTSSQQKTLSPQAQQILQNLTSNTTLEGSIHNISKNVVTVKTALGLLNLNVSSQLQNLPHDKKVFLTVTKPFPNLQLSLAPNNVVVSQPASTFVSQNQFEALISSFDIKSFASKLQSEGMGQNIDKLLNQFPQLANNLQGQKLPVNISNPQNIQVTLDTAFDLLSRINFQQEGPNLKIPGLVLGTDQMGQTLIKSVFGQLMLMKSDTPPPSAQTLISLELIFGLLKGKPQLYNLQALQTRVADPQVSFSALQVYYANHIKNSSIRRDASFVGSKTDIVLKFYQLAAFLQTGNDQFMIDEKLKNRFSQDPKILEFYKSIINENRKKYQESFDKEWRTYFMPYFTDEGVDKIDIYVKNITTENHTKMKRFIIEKTFEKLGAIQIDGYYSSDRFFMKVYSAKMIPAEDQTIIKDMFSEYLRSLNLLGKMSFEKVDPLPQPYLQ